MSRSHLGGLLLLATLAPAATAAPAASTCPNAEFCHVPRLVPSAAGAGERIGQAVAAAGSWAALGAPDSERVYVYRFSMGTWQESDVLVPPPGSSGDGFGMRVAMTEDVLLVGAPLDDTNGPQSGATFVYERTAGSWNLADKLAPVTANAFSHFGSAVAIDGTDLLIGAQDAFGGAGAAYLFRQWAGSWIELTWLDLPGSHQYGASVAIQEPYLYVGDWGDDTLGSDAGAVYFYEYGWAFTSLEQVILAPDGAADDRFGWDLALDGRDLLAGAPLHDTGGIDSAGAVYAYRLDTGVAPPTNAFAAKLAACDVELGAQFGHAVGLDGPWALVGAPLTDDGLPSAAGAAYVFRRSGGVAPTWSYADKLIASDAGVDDTLATAVCMRGTQALLGSRSADAAGVDSGAAYVFSVAGAPGGGACPGPVLAMDQRYGTGKAGTLGVPSLSGGSPPVLGGEATTVLENVLGGLRPILVFGLTQAAIPFDAGQLLVGDPHFLQLPEVPPGDALEWPWQIGLDPTLSGVVVFEQVLCFDPGAAGAYQTAQSNGLARVLGF